MRRIRSLWASALAVPLTACGLAPGPAGDTAAGSIQLSMEERELPGVFDRRGLGRPVAGGPDGLWAVVAGLPRPESAVVRNSETGSEVTVPLFRGPTGQDPADIRLSVAAAEAIGIGDRPQPVHVTALRREPTLLSGR